MKIFIRTIVFIGLITVFIPLVGVAQRYVTRSRTVQLYRVLDVSLNSTSSVFDFSALANYENGITKPGMITATVKANVPWKLTLTLGSNTLSPQVTPTPMPASVMGIKTSTSATYTPVQNNTPFFVQNNRGLYTIIFDLRALPGYQYETEEYIGDFYFTVSQQ